MNHRGAMTMMHGMLFGAFFLFAAYAMVLELFRQWHPHNAAPMTARGRRLESLYLGATAALGWLAVFSGTYLVYPWYRMTPPAGADLRNYPRSLLLSSASTAGLHSLGMEWKEHIAFIAPIVFTALAWIFYRYPGEVRRQPEVRRTLLVFGVAALLSAAVPGVVGAFLNKAAPTEDPRASTAVHAEMR
jgi:hypothetical protein